MKQVLITNFCFEKYTGSELHVLEVARWFQKKNYEVTIAVFKKAYPLLENAGTIHVVDVANEPLEVCYFDIVFAQHYPVLDYLCCKYELSYKHLIISKLSVISDLEYLPAFTTCADLILCVSEECANEVHKVIGKDSRVKVFKNSVGPEFFVTEQGGNDKKQLKKIAIISNHVPEELQLLTEIMSDEYELDYIGMHSSPRYVDASLLKEYDLVITIGRTVQQCFALKTPVYVYDQFGGPGYITDANFDLAEKNNFSGRGFGRLTALELKTDIINNFETNQLRLDKLNSIAQEKYSFEKNFEKIYQDILKQGTEDKKKMNFFVGEERLRMTMYGKAAKVYGTSPYITSQLYLDYGEGFSEANSIKWHANENYTITRTFEIDRRVVGLRIDPCDVPADCYLCNVTINGKIKEEYTGKNARFMDCNSQFVIALSEQEKTCQKMRIQISYRFSIISWEKVGDAYSEVVQTLEQAKNQINILEDTIEAIKEYYKITPKNIMKRILGILKRKLKFTQDR